MKLLSLLIAMMTLLPGSARPAIAGNEGPHGGDVYALEFTTIGASLADQLAQFEKVNNSLFTKWNFTAEQFREAVLGSPHSPPVRVVSEEHVYLNALEVGAINDSTRNLIIVSRSAWRESQLGERVRLVFHEYLGILGVEQDRYDASMDFASFISAATQVISQQSVQSPFMANLYYGYARSYPALSASQICDPASPSTEEAVAQAKAQAAARCEMNGSSSCQTLNVALSEIVSADVIGMAYCEILVLVK